MKLYNKIQITLLFLFVAITTSCNKDYLDVSDELAGQITMEQLFSRPNLVKQFHRSIFTGIPDSSCMIFDLTQNLDGFDNPWAGSTDELKMSYNPLKDVTTNGYNSQNARFQRWTKLYQLIRQANLFLENAKVIPKSGTEDAIDEVELASMKAQAKFLRAYYHYMLFELYGPIPIMKTSADPSSPDLDFARNSVDEVVDFIDSELTEVAGQLEGKYSLDTANDPIRGLPTTGVALAVKAKLWMYAASPLLNGGFPDALAIKNKDGKSIFPAFDSSKWQKALVATQAMIDYAEAGNYQLYKNAGAFDPNLSLYELFAKYNDEIIWASSMNNWLPIDNESTDRRMMPRTEGGFASIAVTQELVDDFFMMDGLPITESPLYTENGFSAAGDDLSGQTSVGIGTYKMWINREPRFYQTVMFQGRKWHNGTNIVKFDKGSGNNNSNGDSPISGYLLYKRLDKTVKNSDGFRYKYRPAIIFRLAEFYLLYAEALNEVNPGDSRVLEYVDRVRERAGIPKLSVIKPGIQGNQQAQRLAIRREMRVELATEGQRYFDVRRWMIADKPEGHQGGDFFGMNMEGNNDSQFCQRTRYETRFWDKKMYLYPIPLTEMQKSTKLVQNPGW